MPSTSYAPTGGRRRRFWRGARGHQRSNEHVERTTQPCVPVRAWDNDEDAAQRHAALYADALARCPHVTNVILWVRVGGYPIPSSRTSTRSG